MGPRHKEAPISNVRNKAGLEESSTKCWRRSGGSPVTPDEEVNINTTKFPESNVQQCSVYYNIMSC